ncbi:MAG TPA: pyridoxal 5'-phosphate synthase glutaminase subunit PdxT [Candidatus Diapherotrites archaeon]|uniref:Pyridoxal 5'-phosphate synthase subunit PdxT n=1 Tax=Candidatus Iainarchaeum sp. TaxID=3101447 RepID=A0A7J4JH56_9ARCH|nr:pyridoxal 5'-phosphate synthase glutaminase subunit PdxT [Candidatus Diapherotrites archaeon]
MCGCRNEAGSVKRVGVLALQGDFFEHLQTLKKLGVEAAEVRNQEDLAQVQGLVIPGGESTTMSQLLAETGLDQAIRARAKQGMAVYGTCVRAILLAKKVLNDGGVKGLGLMDISVERNAYGRQVDSFEAELEANGLGKLKGVFIRAPVIQSVGRGVEVLASLDGKPVLVRQGNLLAGTFHPEIEGEARVHQWFVERLKAESTKHRF